MKDIYCDVGGVKAIVVKLKNRIECKGCPHIQGVWCKLRDNDCLYASLEPSDGTAWGMVGLF